MRPGPSREGQERRVGHVGQSWMKPTKPESTRRHKKAQEELRCGQIAPHGSAERLRCVDARS